MSLLLEASNNVMSYVLIAVVAILLIAMPILMNARNKRESQRVQEQTNSLKVGDQILTTSGVYGKITEVKFDDTQKMIVIETGGKTKSYLTIDAYAVYQVISQGEGEKKEEKQADIKQEEKKEKSQKK